MDLPLGVYRGPNGIYARNAVAGPAGSGILDYEKWLGRRVSYVLDYMTNGPTGWTQFEQCNLYRDPTRRLDGWSTFDFDGRVLMLGLSACSGRSTGTGGATWAHEAAGVNDAHWTALGNRLIALGHGNACLRIGREFNYGGYDWSPSVTGDTPAQYIAGYRHVVALLRALPGARFTFMWNPGTPTGTMVGQTGANAEVQTWYPGDGYVDSIGLDVYDWGGYPAAAAAATPRTQAEQDTSWATAHLLQPDGLHSWISFAAAHGKPLSFPEWGLELWLTGGTYYGGGDNPTFIRRMFGQMLALPVPLHSAAMWEDPGMGLFDDDSYPGRQGGIVPAQSRTAFLALFGSGQLGPALAQIDALLQALDAANELARRAAASEGLLLS